LNVEAEGVRIVLSCVVIAGLMVDLKSFDEAAEKFRILGGQDLTYTSIS
jgi:hypothetical protein